MRAIFLGLTVLAAATAVAQTETGDVAIETLRGGKNFIATPVFSAEADAELLTLFKGLRVADVSDGMDAVGLHRQGLILK